MATIENFATVNYTSAGTAQTKVSNLAEIGLESAVTISKSSLGQSYGENSLLTYIITLTNTSTSPISALNITDDLGRYTFGASELTPLTYTPPALLLIDGQDRTSSLTVSQTSDGITFSFPSLQGASSANIIYRASVNEYAPLATSSTIVNTATLQSSSDCAQGEASETVSVAQAANVSVFKQMTPNPVVCGDTVTYTVRIYNYGNIPAENLQLSDNFDPAPTDITISRDGTPLGTADFSYVNGLLTVPAAASASNISVPAATFTQDPTTGAVGITPGLVEYVISGII